MTPRVFQTSAFYVCTKVEASFCTKKVSHITAKILKLLVLEYWSFDVNIVAILKDEISRNRLENISLH